MTHDSAAQPPIPANFGGLTLLEELGAGEHGTVYRARVERETHGLTPGAIVAAKFLRTDLVQDADAVRRFREEARIGREVRHPSVLSIYGLEENTWLGLPLVYLLMEYVEGSTLRTVLQSGAAVEALVRLIGAESSAGLAALHRARVLHRDIKPENLILTQDGNCKVMDLGFATQRSLLRGRARSAGVRGSLAYLAPECLRGRPASAAADVYALGTTLYELATGRHPFAAPGDRPSADEMIRRVLDERPQPPSHWRPRLSPFADHVLLQMLDKRAELRPSADEAHALWRQGEDSQSWQESERRLPLLRSERRLRASRRPAATRLIDRKAEMARLEEEFAAAERGELRIVHLHGPQGVGKRRLVDEWVARQLARKRALRYYAVVAGQEHESGHSNPLAGVLVEHYSGQTELDSFQALDRLSSRLVQIGDFEEDDAQDLAEALLARHLGDERTFPAGLAAEALRRVGEFRRPLVLRLHRAERLDPATLRTLEFLAEEGAYALILLVTHDEGRKRNFGKLPTRELELEQFSQSHAEQFASELFLDPAEGVRAARELGVRQAPVPGLLLDTLRDMLRDGLLDGSEGSYRNARFDTQLSLGAGLEGYLASHWGRLGEPERRALAAAAVLGLVFDVSDVAQLLGEKELHILELLSPLRDSWVLATGARLRFKRTSQREAVLGFIGRGERMRLHARAAQLLSEREADPLVSGLHWSRAGQHDQALPPLLDAARARLESGELDRVRGLLRRAELHLRQLPRIPEHLRSWLRHHELAAQLAARQGRPERAQSLLQNALSMALPLGDAAERARLEIQLARVAEQRGFVSQAYAMLQAAKARLPQDETNLDYAQSMLLEAELLGELGFLREGLAAALDARRRVRAHRGEHPVLFARCTSLLARFEAARLRIELADRHFEECERAFRDLGLVHDLEWTQILRARFELELGRGPRAEARLLGLQARSSLPPHQHASEALLARAALYDGRHAEAEQRFAELEELGQRMELQSLRLEGRLYGIECRSERNRSRSGPGSHALLQSLSEDAEAALLEAEALGIPRPIFLARGLAARCARLSGELDRSLALVGDALAELREHSLEPTWILRFWLERSETLAALGRPREARRTSALAKRLLSALAARLPQRAERLAFQTATPVRRRIRALR
jgi:serine/threonine protein kinase